MGFMCAYSSRIVFLVLTFDVIMVVVSMCFDVEE